MSSIQGVWFLKVPAVPWVYSVDGGESPPSAISPPTLNRQNEEKYFPLIINRLSPPHTPCAVLDCAAYECPFDYLPNRIRESVILKPYIRLTPSHEHSQCRPMTPYSSGGTSKSKMPLTPRTWSKLCSWSKKESKRERIRRSWKYVFLLLRDFTTFRRPDLCFTWEPSLLLRGSTWYSGC